MIYKEKPNSSVKSQYDLTGKNIVITGGAGFLGRHFAAAVAEMGAKKTSTACNNNILSSQIILRLNRTIRFFFIYHSCITLLNYLFRQKVRFVPHPLLMNSQ
jgi:FlaA1/EpsC-like NDP-sugar epimerase